MLSTITMLKLDNLKISNTHLIGGFTVAMFGYATYRAIKAYIKTSPDGNPLRLKYPNMTDLELTELRELNESKDLNGKNENENDNRLVPSIPILKWDPKNPNRSDVVIDEFFKGIICVSIPVIIIIAMPIGIVKYCSPIAIGYTTYNLINSYTSEDFSSSAFIGYATYNAINAYILKTPDEYTPVLIGYIMYRLIRTHTLENKLMAILIGYYTYNAVNSYILKTPDQYTPILIGYMVYRLIKACISISRITV